jgi:hypothetical protein
MDKYSVETDGLGGYQVRVTTLGDEASRIFLGTFATWTDARNWIDNRSRLTQRTDTASGEA